MEKEAIDILKQGRFVKLVNGCTYAISTANDLQDFDLVEIEDYVSIYHFKKEDFDNDFKCKQINVFFGERKATWDIIKIATDINLINIIWERK